ncbi:immunity repressor [Rhodobacter phage RcCWillis]|nr:immunity repressor [Rhodobacter phage RcCWillis]
MRKKLQAARMAAGLSQKEAGAMIGKTQSHYAKFENGRIGLSADAALILCKAFDLSLDDLLELTPE